MSNAPTYFFFFLNYFDAFFSLWAAKRSSVVAVLTAAKQTSIWSLHRVFLFWFSIAVAVKDAITLENNWQDLLPRVWFVVGSGKTKHSNGRRGSNLRSFRDCRSVRCHIFLSHLASLLGGLDVRMDRCLPRYWLLRALSVDKPSASFPGMTVRWFRTFPAWSAFIGVFFFLSVFFFPARVLLALPRPDSYVRSHYLQTQTSCVNLQSARQCLVSNVDERVQRHITLKKNVAGLSFRTEPRCTPHQDNLL